MPRPKKNKIKSSKEKKNIAVPKKRGRKPKDSVPKEEAPKKRGRKPKEPVVASEPPKRRGRKPKLPPMPDQDGPLTKEQLEDRKEKIRATIPKIDLYRVRESIDLVKDKETCNVYTAFSCHRPDIYLDYGCSECVLQKNCACPIKDINRRPDDRRPKFRKFTSAKKSS